MMVCPQCRREIKRLTTSPLMSEGDTQARKTIYGQCFHCGTKFTWNEYWSPVTEGGLQIDSSPRIFTCR